MNMYNQSEHETEFAGFGYQISGVVFGNCYYIVSYLWKFIVDIMLLPKSQLLKPVGNTGVWSQDTPPSVMNNFICNWLI